MQNGNGVACCGTIMENYNYTVTDFLELIILTYNIILRIILYVSYIREVFCRREEEA